MKNKYSTLSRRGWLVMMIWALSMALSTQGQTPFTLTQPTYDCDVTGVITFNTTGGDGSPITYLAPGITRSSATSNKGVIEEGLRNDPKPITIQATQSGQTASYVFSIRSYCYGRSVFRGTSDRKFIVNQNIGNISIGSGDGVNSPDYPGPITIIGLPTGLSITYTSRAGALRFNLVGTPTTVGLYPVTIRVVNPRYPNDTPYTSSFTISVVDDQPQQHPDIAALTDFYNSTNGANWTNNTNWLKDNNPCGWYGVSCDGNGRVSGLQFQFVGGKGNNLNGTLPASLGNLSQLKTLIFFQEPLLKGTLPASLGNLSQLETLRITATQVSGEIPASLGNLSQLKSLTFFENPLSGTLPPSLGNLSQLESINIEYSQINGSIPASLGNLTQLKNLFLAMNQLSGEIPASLGNLSRLQYLYLFGNRLSGSIPASLGNLSQLQQLWISSNQLSGCFPAALSALCGKNVQLDGNAGLPGGGNFAAFCANKTGACPTANSLVLIQPTYNCTTGAITFNNTGGNGTPITYSAPGITRSSATSNSGTVEQGLRNDPKPITIQATQSGQTVSYVFDLKAACSNPPKNDPLKLLEPTVTCLSVGALLTFNTSGGDGSTIIYSVPGVTLSSPTSNTAMLFSCINPNKPLLIQAAQSGYSVSYLLDIKKACPSINIFQSLIAYPIPDLVLTLTQPFDSQIGQYFIDPNGGVRYLYNFSFKSIGLPNGFRLENTYIGQSNVPKLRLYRVAGDAPATPGVYTVTIIGSNNYCSPVESSFKITLLEKPVPSGSLTLTAPTYNCATGAITFNTTGGDGSPVEFQAAGITGWTTNPNQFVDKDSRTASDVKPFTLMARQSGQVVTYTWDLKAACGRARVGVSELSAGLSVEVLGNPAHEQVRVRIEGAEGQSVRLRLTDMQGRLLESRTVEQAGVAEEQTFRLSPSGPGLLLLQAATDGQQKTVKIIRQ